MIISDEQVQRVVEYLHTTDSHRFPVDVPLPSWATSELVDFVVHELELIPDVRADRVAQARDMLAFELPASEVVADKLIGRVLSDSIR
ncbi:MAG: hypothetical protein CVT66_03010 [Actinobacteria bacterium HGW-Actinobacteria-6]|jgi:hypothetical protein|nr:MAG: hypothetical protein CVT66_03010 [Actinobacteria bacterium HGW-Actinobacteria-6]